MKYGRLSVADGAEGKVRDLHKCVCDCGNITYVKLGSLRSGNTKSCGCLQKERLAERVRKHHGKGTPEYNTWSLMRDRCNNPNNKSFSYYGGAGISVCDEWDDFTVFLLDMGKKPTRSHSIDRVDNLKGYNKENCRWTTKKEQVRNRSITVKYTIDGEERPLAEWCEIYETDYQFVYKRIWDGMDVIAALTTGKKGE